MRPYPPHTNLYPTVVRTCRSRPCRRLALAVLAGCAIGLLLPLEESLKQTIMEERNADGDIKDPDDIAAEAAGLAKEDAAAEEECPPKQHIMFLKTHKCASSSIQNIFLRYGIMHELTFALPSKGSYLGHPEPFHFDMVEENLFPPDGIVDIFAVHSRLNGPENKKVLPPDAVFITVVRDPPQLYESLYNYFKLNEFFGASLEEYLRYPLEMQLTRTRYTKRFGPNMMLFDMGVDVRANTTAFEIRRAIEDTDVLFDLVMISERIDESLILLKELLCWDYSDVIFFTKNARKEGIKPSLSEDTIEKLKDLNSGDVLLYNFFLAKHERRVTEYGIEKMQKEIEILENVRQNMFKDCGVKIVDKADAETLFKEYSDQVHGYAVDKSAGPNCLLLSMPELQLLNRMKADARKTLKRGFTMKKHR